MTDPLQIVESARDRLKRLTSGPPVELTGRPRLNLSLSQPRYDRGPEIDISQRFPGYRDVKDVSYMGLAGEALQDAVVGPFAGILERLGVLDDGTRRKIREDYLSAKQSFTSMVDAQSGEIRSESEVLGRKVAANTTAVIANLIPLVPGGIFGKFAQVLFKGGKAAQILARGAAIGAAEGAVIGLGDAALLPEGERGLPAAMSIGVGGLLGAGGAKLGLKVAEKRASRMGKYMADSPDLGSGPERIRRTYDKFYSRMVNEEEPLDRVANDLHKEFGGDATKLKSFVQRLRASKRAAANPLVHGTESWNPKTEQFDLTGESLESIYKDIPDQRTFDELEEYATANREIELHARQMESIALGEGGSGLKLDDEALADALQMKMDVIDSGRSEEFDALLSRFYNWERKSTLMPLRAVGVVSDEDVAKILSKNQTHVPFMRVLREFVKGGQGSPIPHTISEGLSQKNKILRPFEQAAWNAQRVSQFVDRQIVKNTLVELAEEFPDFVPIKRAGTMVNGRVQRLSSDRLKELGIDEATDEAGALFAAMDESPIGQFVHHSINDKGQKVRAVYEAPEDFLRAMKAVPPQQVGALMKTAGAFTKALRAGATIFAPAFIARNLVRDNFTAAVHSKHGFIPFLDPARFLAQELWTRAGGNGASDLWKEFQRSGVAGVTLVGLDRVGAGFELRRAVDLGTRSRFRRSLDRTLKNPLYPIQELSEHIEKVTRFAEFKRARLAGRTVLEAAEAAADVSINFSRGGTFGRQWNMVEAFINAEIQDIDKLSRALTKEGPKRAFTVSAKALSMVTLPAIANWAINHDDPDYQARPEWEKFLFYHIRKGPDGDFIKVPRPIGAVNVLFGLLPETAVRFMAESDPEAGKRLRKGFVEQTPLGMLVDPARALTSITPTVLDPVLENVVNYDFFFEKEVVPRRLQDELKEDQFTAGTSITAREIAGIFNVSPMKVQNLFDGYTATAGREVAKVVDVVAFGAPAIPADPQVKRTGIPFYGGLEKSFLTGPQPYGFESQMISDLYELYDEAQIARKRLDKATTFETRKKVLAEHSEVLLLPEIRKMANKLGEMAVLRRDILADKGLDDVERSERALKIDQYVSTLSATALERWGKILDRVRNAKGGN